MPASLILDPENLHLGIEGGAGVFADLPYHYRLRGKVGLGSTKEALLIGRTVVSNEKEMVVTGHFGELSLTLRQHFRFTSEGIEETIRLSNEGPEKVELSDIELGFVSDLSPRDNWRLCAIPFRVQLDGSLHDYSAKDLQEGRYHNAKCLDETTPPRQLSEDGRLRSEAWSWWNGHDGLLVAKYNPEEIELSVAAPFPEGNSGQLRFGGVGVCLFGEPSGGLRIGANQSHTYGTTFYFPFSGSFHAAFARYRDFLESRGHGFPPDYNPPLTWNVLYDLGWHHSDPEQLAIHYTRESVLREADKARSYGCEMLYLDPGWEIAEGSTLWDEGRLGTVSHLVQTLKDNYGLDLGFRTIMRSYRDEWPQSYLVERADRPGQPAPVTFAGINDARLTFWELCFSAPGFFEEKLRRICEIARHGVRFLMVDEFDWRGPCMNPAHGHAIPGTAAEHAKAVFSLCRKIRERCPQVVIESHDTVWPWSTARYVPVYLQQGFRERGAFQENWGFEYMWNCIEDLRSGKALSLYYYNLATHIPLYLHLTTAADNDQCLFFWWAASTVRHLGIGGKYGSKTVTPPDLKPFDPEARAVAYQTQTEFYRRLKPWFVRGVFHGIHETAHLHTLPGCPGGVLVAYNLSDREERVCIELPLALLQSQGPVSVNGAECFVQGDQCILELLIPAMAPAVICLGNAAIQSKLSKPYDE